MNCPKCGAAMTFTGSYPRSDGQTVNCYQCPSCGHKEEITVWSESVNDG